MSTSVSGSIRKQERPDSGDLETDLPNLFLSVGEAAKAAKRPVVILIDELQYLSQREFSALIMSAHEDSGAECSADHCRGGAAGNSRPRRQVEILSERLFKYPQIGALGEPDAKAAIRDADACCRGRRRNRAGRFGSHSRDYRTVSLLPSAMGSRYLERRQRDVIRTGDVERANAIAIETLDKSFFRVRFRPLHPGRKDTCARSPTSGRARTGKGTLRISSG